MRWPMLLGRVAVRSGVAIWRHRFSVIAAGCIVAAFSVYEFTFAGPTVSNGDCADTAMTAVTHVDDASARAASLAFAASKADFHGSTPAATLALMKSSWARLTSIPGW